MNTLTVGTFNIRCDWTPHGPTAWSVRRDGVRDLMRRTGFDLLGIQEAFVNQVEFLVEPGRWEYVGVGRDDGERGGEYAAIFYNPERLQLQQTGTFWLSQTPDQPSFGWDAVCTRICTWARFIDRTDSASTPVYMFNCHLDHEGIVARERSVALLLSRIESVTSAPMASVPLFLVGDFNMTAADESIRTIETVLTNAVRFGEAQPPMGTFTGFDPADAVAMPIDHIFVSDAVRVDSYEVLPSEGSNGLLVSDHRPVVVKASASA